MRVGISEAILFGLAVAREAEDHAIEAAEDTYRFYSKFAENLSILICSRLQKDNFCISPRASCRL